MQPPGEPREHRLGEVRPKKFDYFIKDKMTGRVDVLWHIIEKIAKKVKNKVTGTEKRCFCHITLKTSKNFTFGSCDFKF